MKKIGLLFISLMLVFGLTGCKKKENVETDASKFKKEYENLNGKKNEKGSYSTIEIPEDNAIVYSDVSEILSILEDGTGVIYFGYPECPWCRSMISTLTNTASMVGLGKIYYFNASEIRDTKHLDENGKIVTDKEGTEEYYDLLKALDLALPSYEGLQDESIKRLYFPTVVFVKDGKIIKTHVGTVESQKDPNVLLTEEQEKELSGIYAEAMHQILGDVCDESC